MIITDGKNIKQSNFTAVTLGNFDGIHRGHNKLIETTRQYGRKYSLKTVVFSFYPHPVSIIKKDKPFYTILSREEKIEEIAMQGIDIFVEYPFSLEFASMEPYNFVKDILCGKLNCKVLVVGNDYCFGKNRKGNFELLQKYGKEFGFEAIRIGAVEKFGERVSSTNIRKCIAQRNLKMAEALLGKKYFITGIVCRGNQIGRTIGFPTANLIPCSDKLLPPDGVYITTCEYGGRVYKSITNIGNNPTLNGITKTVETFLFDFSEEIYGEKIRVSFHKFIREEFKFSGIEKLKNQLESDKIMTEEFFVHGGRQ